MSPKRGLLLLLSIIVFSFTVLAAGPPGSNGPGKDKSSSPQKAWERPTNPNLYVGSDTCKTCHEDMPTKGFYKSFEDSRHFLTTLDTKKGPEWHGCEACHGPGKEHVEGGGDKTKIFTSRTPPPPTSARAASAATNTAPSTATSRARSISRMAFHALLAMIRIMPRKPRTC